MGRIRHITGMKKKARRWIIALVGPFLTIVVLAYWRNADDIASKFSRIDTELHRIDTKLDDLNREVGELKVVYSSPTP